MGRIERVSFRPNLLRRLARLLALRLLACPHVGVEAIGTQERDVAAAFGEATVLHHEDFVGVGDR